MAKKKAHKTRRTSKKPYNVKRAIEAHTRLREKNRGLAGRNMKDDKKFAFYYGKNYYHSDMIEKLQERNSKIPVSEKKVIYARAKDRARKDCGL